MLIRVENASKRFRGRNVLDDINAEFESGKIYGLIGINGSGKTMLLRLLCGLIVPSDGKIHVDGKQLHKDLSFPHNTGVLIEKPEFLNSLTGLENLKILASIKDIISDEKIKEFMKLFSLDPEDKKPIRKYSLGMKQKIGIIQAIMEDPSFLVLDEPFNALDESSAEMLKKMLLLYREEGKLIIITSHHREDIEDLCDYVYKMDDGKITESIRCA